MSGSSFASTGWVRAGRVHPITSRLCRWVCPHSACLNLHRSLVALYLISYPSLDLCHRLLSALGTLQWCHRGAQGAPPAHQRIATHDGTTNRLHRAPSLTTISMLSLLLQPRLTIRDRLVEPPGLRTQAQRLPTTKASPLTPTMKLLAASAVFKTIPVRLRLRTSPPSPTRPKLKTLAAFLSSATSAMSGSTVAASASWTRPRALRITFANSARRSYTMF